MTLNRADASSTWRMLVVVGGAVLAAGVAFAWSRALFPLLAGFLFAYLCHPLASWLERHHLPRILGFLLFLLLFVGLALFIALVFLPALVNELAAIGQKLPSWQEVMQERVGPFLQDLQRRYPQGYAMMEERLTQWAQQNLPSIAQRVARWGVEALGSALGLVGLLLNLVLIPVIGAYLTVDFRRFIVSLRGLIPRPVLPTVEEVVRDVHAVLSSFIKGQLLVSLALAVMYTGGLLLVGSPLALVIGPLAGVLSLVPYLGLVVGAGTSFVLALLEYQELGHPLLVLVVFVVAQVVEAWVLTPRLLGKSVGLHPVWVLVALLVGGELFGLPGVIIGVPVAAALRVVLLRAVRAYRESVFYGGAPPEVIFYTRRDCELCDEAEALLTSWSGGRGVGVQRVDVDGTPALVAHWSERVPVVTVNGRVVAEGRLAPEEFERLMDEATGGTS